MDPQEKKCPDCRHKLKFHGAARLRDKKTLVFLGCCYAKRGKFCRCARVGK